MIVDRGPGAAVAQSFPVPGAMSRECVVFRAVLGMAPWLLSPKSYERQDSISGPWRRSRDRRRRRSLLSSLAPEPSRRQRLAADLDACGRRRSAEADRGLDAVGHPLRSRAEPGCEGSGDRLGAEPP